MDRTLDFFPFLTAVAAIGLCLFVCFVNMYLFSKHKTSLFTLFVHAVSLFSVYGLICYMLGAAVFVLPLSALYFRLARMSLLFLAASIFAGVFVFAVRRNRPGYVNRSQNIAEALSIIEDIVFVADMDGVITQVNHPDIFRSMFGRINTMDELRHYIKENCGICSEQSEELEKSEGSTAIKLIHENAVTHYIYKVYPIAPGGKPLGYTAILENVSAIRQDEKILGEQNDYLKQANEKLSNYVRVAGALEAEKERLQILEHVQATMIRDVETALSEIRRIKADNFEDNSYRAAAKTLAARLRQVYDDVRGAIGKIAGKEA